MKFLLSIISLLFLAEGCKTAEKTANITEDQEKKAMTQQTLSGTYSILEINQKSDFKQNLTISFDEASNQVTGFCGCNNFYSSYATKDDQIIFIDIASSKKYCGKEIGDLEENFISTLKNTNKIKLSDNTLVFYHNDDITITAKKLEVSKPNKAEQTTKGDMVKDNYTKTMITYQASSRGAFEYVLIAKSGVTVSNDRNLKIKKSYYCNPKDWEAITILLDKIDTSQLDQLNAPTDNRLHDGALHATLSIIKGDVEMMTPSFDHGTPPQEIEALVNKVLSIKESITKQ